MSSIYATTLRRAAASRILPHTGRLLLPSAATTTTTSTDALNLDHQRRWLATPRKKKGKGKQAINGNRGSRGHGWLTKYRQGRGGRSLQGDYWDRNKHHWDMQQWNDAVLSLGSQFVYLDIAAEPPTMGSDARATAPVTTSITENDESEADEPIDISVAVPKAEEMEGGETNEHTEVVEATDDSSLKAATDDSSSTGTRSIKTERLIIQIASTVMPETCINFVGLLQDAAYKGSILYRIEKEVGICGGDILTNTGKTGQCWQSWPYENHNTRIRPHPLRRDLPPASDEPMALWHTAGTVAMLCPKVNEIDSRFILCAKDSPHLDGIHRAFGKLTPDSLAVVDEWRESVLTFFGKPKSVTLRIVGCGVLEDYKQESASSSSSSSSSKKQEETAAP